MLHNLPKPKKNWRKIYIHLIALSLFDIDQVLPLIGDIHLPHIQWASSIIAYIKNSLKSTIYENITFKPFPLYRI